MNSTEPNKIHCLFDIRIPMRDGTELSADIYLPEAEGSYPALVMRTPYDNTAERHLAMARFMAEHGYAFVFQDVRGRGDSDGKFIPFVNEGKDGFDTIEWVAAQPWCNGKIGTLGGSYLGTVQWLAAKERPPHLVTMVSSAPAGRWLQELPYMNGKILLDMLMWLDSVGGRTNQSVLQNPAMGGVLDWKSLLLHSPTITADEIIGRTNTVWREWISHRTFDDYWRKLSLQGSFSQLNLPVLHITGWYDGDQPGALFYYNHMLKESPASDKQFLLSGPWLHSGVWFPEQKLGGMVFGETAIHDIKEIHLHWFDHWLKGEQNGLAEESRAKLFIMGSNAWQETSAFPPPESKPFTLYLQSHGDAQTNHGDGSLTDKIPSELPEDEYLYNPEDPTPSAKNYGFSDDEFYFDRSYAEERPDVLVYTSQPVDQEILFAGIPWVTLYASSDTVDTDFAVVLTDVYPDGRSYFLAEGILRASYRESLTEPTLIQPGKVYEYKIELNATANSFISGHSIRLEVMSCYFPKYERNPNTGDPPGEEKSYLPARLKIFHTATYPSRLILPIQPSIRKIEPVLNKESQG